MATDNVFVDYKGMKARVDAWADRILFRVGGYTRGVFTRNIKRNSGGGRTKSAPGGWPFTHAPGGQALRFHEFAVDRHSKSVIIGMKRYRDRGQFEGTRIARKGGLMIIKPIGKTVAQNVNEGGINSVRMFWKSGMVTQGKSRHKRRPFTSLAMPIVLAFMRRIIAQP